MISFFNTFIVNLSLEGSSEGGAKGGGHHKYQCHQIDAFSVAWFVV